MGSGEGELSPVTPTRPPPTPQNDFPSRGWSPTRGARKRFYWEVVRPAAPAAHPPPPDRHRSPQVDQRGSRPPARSCSSPATSSTSTPSRRRARFPRCRRAPAALVPRHPLCRSRSRSPVEAPFVLVAGNRAPHSAGASMRSSNATVRLELVDFKTGRIASDGWIPPPASSSTFTTIAQPPTRPGRPTRTELRTAYCWLRTDGPPVVDSRDWDAGHRRRRAQAGVRRPRRARRRSVRRHAGPLVLVVRLPVVLPGGPGRTHIPPPGIVERATTLVECVRRQPTKGAPWLQPTPRTQLLAQGTWNLDTTHTEVSRSRPAT